MEIKNRTIALLIDSDNISAKYLELLINEVSKFGNITYKRIYGDFTAPNAGKWRKDLNNYAIEPIQQYLITTKAKDKNRELTFNVTDSTMIIDAMDILYKHNVDCVCLATSDSDFTRLAIRFRNENYVVIGVGEKKTPQSFIAACHRFILIDALLEESEQPAEEQAKEAKIEVPPTEDTSPQPQTVEHDGKQEANAPLPAEDNAKEKRQAKETNADIPPTEIAPPQPQTVEHDGKQEENAPLPAEDNAQEERQAKETNADIPPTEDTPPQPQTVQNDVEQKESDDETREENTPAPIEKIVEISKAIISEYANDDGWLLMSTFSYHLYNRVNTFDSRHYGYKRHTPLFKNLFYAGSEKPIFELKTNEKDAYLIRIAEE